MDVLIVNREEVECLLDPAALLAALRDGFRALSAGRIAAPERNELAMPGEAFLLGMPGHRAGAHMTVKVVTVFERNLARGLPSHLATIGLYDPDTGACTCFMDGRRSPRCARARLRCCPPACWPTGAPASPR